MALYKYIKETRKPPLPRSIYISFFFIGIGFTVLVWVAWPILYFELVSASVLTSIVSPLGNTTYTVYAGSQQDITNEWLPKVASPSISASKVTAYALSIPSLNISNAFVQIGGTDLNQGIIHYQGTSLPGEIGNSALFGHSVLPQFFNPTNYKTIFSTLPTIAVGAEILVTYDGVTYKYIVEEKNIKEADDVSVLDQPTDGRYITLVTCVPPGTYWKRLHVKAKLAKLE